MITFVDLLLGKMKKRMGCGMIQENPLVTHYNGFIN